MRPEAVGGVADGEGGGFVSIAFIVGGGRGGGKGGGRGEESLVVRGEVGVADSEREGGLDVAEECDGEEGGEEGETGGEVHHGRGSRRVSSMSVVRYWCWLYTYMNL